MKIVVALAFILLVCYSSSAPIADDCELLFSEAVCLAYKGLDDEISSEVSNDANDVDENTKEFLRNALKKKLEFLINLGLLQRVPLVGQIIHDFVANDPEGVARALEGGIFGLITIGQHIVGRILQG